MAWSRTITNFGSTSLSYEKSVAQGEHIVLLAQDALLEEDGDLHSSDSFNWESEVSDDGVEYRWVNLWGLNSKNERVAMRLSPNNIQHLDLKSNCVVDGKDLYLQVKVGMVQLKLLFDPKTGEPINR